jgi:hypothetical protein
VYCFSSFNFASVIGGGKTESDLGLGMVDTVHDGSMDGSTVEEV